MRWSRYEPKGVTFGAYFQDSSWPPLAKLSHFYEVSSVCEPFHGMAHGLPGLAIDRSVCLICTLNSVKSDTYRNSKVFISLSVGLSIVGRFTSTKTRLCFPNETEYPLASWCLPFSIAGSQSGFSTHQPNNHFAFSRPYFISLLKQLHASCRPPSLLNSGKFQMSVGRIEYVSQYPFSITTRTNLHQIKPLGPAKKWMSP